MDKETLTKAKKYWIVGVKATFIVAVFELIALIPFALLEYGYPRNEIISLLSLIIVFPVIFGALISNFFKKKYDLSF